VWGIGSGSLVSLLFKPNVACHVRTESTVISAVESGLTQREVSLRLGMAHSFMNKCESGERAIDIAELWARSNIYGKPLSHFAPDKV
jgi:hypothetical protein